MPRFFVVLPFLLALSAVHAQTVGANEPAQEGHPIGTIVFIILFVGACVAFFWFVWRNEQKAKRKKGELTAEGRDAHDANS
jgi:hypothetical protein